MENVYANVLCIMLISLPTMNAKNILEQLKENLNCITIIPPCHLDTRSMKTIQLSKYLWKLKENTYYNLQWSIKAYPSPYKCGTRKCDLSLTEKMIIARSLQKKLLNKRTDLVSKCRHRNKFLLNNLE